MHVLSGSTCLLTLFCLNKVPCFKLCGGAYDGQNQKYIVRGISLELPLVSLFVFGRSLALLSEALKLLSICFDEGLTLETSNLVTVVKLPQVAQDLRFVLRRVI